jgi:hypothetical protein
MGADLIYCGQLAPAGQSLDWEAGLTAAKNYTLDMVQENALKEIFFNEEDDMFPKNDEDLRTYLVGMVTTARDALHGRGGGDVSFAGYTYYFVADMSWGDSPYGCDEVAYLAWFPEILAAIGFLFQWPN